jgi:uncharacterized membrane protein
MDWKQILAYISGSVEEELLMRLAYLVAENRLLRDQITGRVHLSDAKRRTLATIGTKLSKPALVHIAGVTPHPNASWMMQIARNETRGIPRTSSSQVST